MTASIINDNQMSEVYSQTVSDVYNSVSPSVVHICNVSENTIDVSARIGWLHEGTDAPNDYSQTISKLTGLKNQTPTGF